MTAGSRAALQQRIVDLRAQAAALALHERARPAVTTLAIERATLRLLGVQGLDARGGPLAATVVEHLAGTRPAELGGGIALPLAAAATARAMSAQEAALAVASGEIDLGVESQFLQHPERLASAEGLLGAWIADAFERVDANRTARHEVSDALGVADEPWLGARIGAFTLDSAIGEARAFVAAGADALIVRVPPGRELRGGARAGGDEPRPPEMDPPPAGSQRGLAAMRGLLDEIAAERGRYLFLATTTEGLAAPEQAVVAGFERVDLVFADPFDEIARGIDAQRAFTDHAAALRLLARSGTTVILGPGALLAGQELARGEPLDAPKRIGRSIAAQAASAAWATAMGVTADQLLLQAPFESPIDSPSGALLLAELTVRRMLHPDHALAITQPADGGTDAWRVGLALSLLAAPGSRLVVPEAGPDEFPARAADARTAADLVQVLLRSLGSADGRRALPIGDEVIGAAIELAAIALDTLDQVMGEGWTSLVGSGNGAGDDGTDRLGRAGLVAAPMYAGPLGVKGSGEGG